MGKGILLEVEGRSGVVLTPKGEFKRVPLPQGSCAVGDEITFQEQVRSTPRWGWVAAAAAVLLTLLTPLGYQSWALAQPAALVLIDINPSVALTLNGRDQVVNAEGLNEDGERVLEGVEWQKQDLEEVTRAVMARAVATGKLQPADEGSAVVMAVAPVDQKELKPEKALALAERAKSAATEEVKVQAAAKGEEVQTEVASFEASPAEVAMAKEQGITLPKFIIYETLSEEMPELTIDSFEGKGPGQFLKELGLNPSEVFSKASEHRKNPKVEPASGKDRSDDKPGKGDDDSDDSSGKSNGNQSKDDAGKSKENAGQSKKNQSKDAPGQSKENPGQSKDDSGKSKENPGQSKGDEKDRPDKKDDQTSGEEKAVVPDQIGSPGLGSLEEEPEGENGQSEPDRSEPNQGKQGQEKPDQVNPDRERPDHSDKPNASGQAGQENGQGKANEGNKGNDKP